MQRRAGMPREQPGEITRAGQRRVVLHRPAQESVEVLLVGLRVGVGWEHNAQNASVEGASSNVSARFVSPMAESATTNVQDRRVVTSTLP